MLQTIAKSLFGSSNDRYVKSLGKIVNQINALEPQMQALPDEALKAKTEEFKARIAKGESLDKLLPEAFATVRALIKTGGGIGPLMPGQPSGTSQSRRWCQLLRGLPGSRER